MKPWMIPTLNEFDKGVFAWSTKKLTRSQKKCIRIRNSAGSEIDILYKNGTMDKGLIGTFANGALATVVTLYDSSLNKNNAYNSVSALQWSVTDAGGVPLDYISAASVSGGSYMYMVNPKHPRFSPRQATFLINYSFPSTGVDRHVFSFCQIDTNVQYRIMRRTAASKISTYVNTAVVNNGDYDLEATPKISVWQLDLTKTTSNSILERVGKVTDTQDVTHTIDPTNCWFMIGARSSSTSTGAALTANRFNGNMSSFVMLDKIYPATTLTKLKGAI
jgi:hypothetical protein